MKEMFFGMWYLIAASSFKESWAMGIGGGSCKSQAIRVDNNRWNMFQYDYDLTTITLFASPYSTDCLDYNQAGFSSQSKCIQACIAKASLAFATNPFEVAIYEA